ncbi:MAG: 3-methyl-2-oxobutanoate hydroxymethyltransferase [Persephonella sp.]|nr:MAG: 3-methyl-2-oxobutanoate hydroxymethyltransferase [Persephonella sp.]
MKTILDFLKVKRENKKITMISTYDYWSALICEEVGIDCILVGDSLGMVVQGQDSTLPVSLDEIIYHAKAVRRGAPNTFIVVDMPFLTYQVNKEEALKNAGRIMQETGANAVKLEGGEEILETVEKLVKSGIPVMGHLGLTPQSVHALGGYKVQGKTKEKQEKLKRDAKLLQDAGVFSIVLEAIPKSLAEDITNSLEIPTIGIGAGNKTDGQVLVFHDLLGFFDKSPKFVKRYLEGKKLFKDAISQFIKEVEEETFPDEKHTYL